jgi:hypothetical protein
MLMLTIASLFIGALLGQRFKVFILVPACMAAILAIVSLGIMRGESASALALAIVLVVTSLQMGYLAGTVGRLIGARETHVRAGAAVHGPVS